MAVRGWISRRSIPIIDLATMRSCEDADVTKIEIRLPDDLAQRARSAGLLSDSAIRELLEDAMRRRAGHRLMAAAGQLHEAGIPAMSDEDLVGEVRAVRAARRVGRQKVQTPERT